MFYGRFVCLDDITDKYEKMNYVVYNPSKNTKTFRKQLLFNTIKAGTEVELTEDQLESLMKHDVNHLTEFVKELKEIVFSRKKEVWGI